MIVSVTATAPRSVGSDRYPIAAGDLSEATTRDAADQNRGAIQAALDNYAAVELPRGRYDVTADPTLGVGLAIPAYGELAGAGKTATMLRAHPGQAIDAVIASRLWADGQGTADNEGRGIRVRDLGVAYNWKSTSGAEQQTGIGHGIALCGYQCQVLDCYVTTTKKAGILLDTSDKLNVAKGESIENTIARCQTKVTGTNGIRLTDSGSSSTGGITDGWIRDCNVVSWNTSASTSEADASGIYSANSGGWIIDGNHLYGSSSLPSWAAAYGQACMGHGIFANSAYGTRITNNQIADFGYHPAAAGDSWCGVKLQGWSNRGFTIAGNVFWPSINRMLNQARAVRAIFVNTVGNATSGGLVNGAITGNVWNQRDQNTSGQQPATPTLRGIKIVETSGGSIGQLIIAANAAGNASVVPLEAAAAVLSKLKVAANSWQ